MASPSLPALQQLEALDRSSSDFQDQLCNALYKEDYKRCVKDLQGENLEWLIDYLDKALNHLKSSPYAARKCLRELRTICGTKGILPTSYKVSPELLNVDLEALASGGFGDVYRGTLNGSNVCVKRARVNMQNKERITKDFCKEAVTWKQLKHPNVLLFLGVTTAPFQLVSDWMPGGDLLGFIRKRPDSNRLKLLIDITQGLNYLHSSNVIHGDLKGNNILVDHSDCARIADFGLSTITRNLQSTHSTSTRPDETARWSAPEFFMKDARCSKEADVYSFSMVMIEVFTGAIPFNDRTRFMAMIAITKGERPVRPEHKDFTDDLWKLMQRCWDPEPGSRPSISEALSVLS